MRKITQLLTICFVIGYVLPSLGQFETSLHKTRNGKPTWYDQENGGFETLTNVPIEDLGCVECHDQYDANGNEYTGTYTPDCVDCHATNTPPPPGPVTQDDCLGCHGREAAIISMGKEDVHRSLGMECMDCHESTDLHGDGTEYDSMFELGAITTDCENSGCHEGFTHPAQDPHGGALHCTSCHASTNLACYNCHFESQVLSHVKRAKQQITGFQILVNRDKDGKVHPATFQSLSYQGNTWIAMGPSVAHTIIKEGARTCADCHANPPYNGDIEAINDWNADGIIQFASWNSGDSTLSWLQGIVPLPVDYKRSFKLDFITYNGDPSDPPDPSKNWSFVKGEADGFQLLYATPLTTTQMSKLGMDTNLVSVRPVTGELPNDFRLDQNYPNPFNPATTIRFSLPERSHVELVIYDALGDHVETLVNGEQEAGVYEVEFDARGLASGVYFYHIKSNSYTSTKKLVLMK